MSEPDHDLCVPPASPSLALKERWSRPVGIVSLCAVFFLAFMVLDVLSGKPYLIERATASFYLALAFIGIALVSLLIGAILVLRRQPLGWDFHIFFGSLGLLLGLAMVWEQASDFYPKMTTYGPASTLDLLPSILFVDIITLAYPIFVLSWFFREKVREDVKSWGRRATSTGA